MGNLDYIFPKETITFMSKVFTHILLGYLGRSYRQDKNPCNMTITLIHLLSLGCKAQMEGSSFKAGQYAP